MSDPMPPFPQAPAPKRMSRLWLLLPAGCLGSFVMITFIAFAGVAFIMNMIKSSDVYVDALAAAQANTEVQEALGTPIRSGFLVSGNIETSTAGGNASLAIPISGPDGSGTLLVEALMTGGVWDYQSLTVRIADTGATIDLLESDDDPV
mgnify:CR=1 FL=1